MPAVTDIAPGSTVQVTVKQAPTNEAAAKTLVRILSKDAVAKANDKRLRQARKDHKVVRVRSGRPWAVLVPKQPTILPEVGVTGTIVADYQTLKDLASVERFIDVATS